MQQTIKDVIEDYQNWNHLREESRLRDFETLSDDDKLRAMRQDEEQDVLNTKYRLQKAIAYDISIKTLKGVDVRLYLLKLIDILTLDDFVEYCEDTFLEEGSSFFQIY